MQGTRVRSLLWEDPTCHRAAEPCTIEPVLHNKRSQSNEKLEHHNKGSPSSPQPEKAHAQQQRPNMTKNKEIFKKLLKAKGLFSCAVQHIRVLIFLYIVRLSRTLWDLPGRDIPNPQIPWHPPAPLGVLHSWWDLSSLSRDWTQALSKESMES